jgi:hypothetical protein
MVDKLKLLVIILFAAVGIGAWPSSGNYGGQPLNRDFYFAATGNDSFDCASIATACQTLANLNSLTYPTHATVHLHGGDTFTGSITVPQNNFTITSYGTGQAIISSGNSSACINGDDKSSLTINNINCTGGGVATNTTDGIDTGDLSGPVLTDITITNNTVSGYGGTGISVGSAVNTANAVSGVVINNNVVHDNNEGIIADDGSAFGPHLGVISNVTVSGNTVYNNTGASCLGPGCIGGFGILFGGVQTGTIQNNLVHDNGIQNTSAGGGPEGIATSFSDSILIQFNEVYRQGDGHSPASVDGQGIDFNTATTNSTMQYNYSHDNCQALHAVGQCSDSETHLAGTGNVIRFNIFQSTQNVPAFLVGLQNTGNSIAIYNNTFLVTGSSPILTGGSSGNTHTFANNIFDSVNNNVINYINLTGTINLTGNGYHNDGGSLSVDINGTGYTSLAALQAAGFEKVSGSPVGFDANPNLTGSFPASTCGTATTVGWNASCPLQYTLSSSSRAGKGKGLNLNTVYGYNVGTQDFFGNAVTNTTLPIGAAANK